MSARLASGLVALCTALIAGVGANAAVLPGIADFPVVEGSEIVDCPSGDGSAADRVCISMPRNNEARPIAQAYQEHLQARGFELRVGHDMAIFVKNDGPTCEVVLLGSAYAAPDEREEVIVMEFRYLRGSAEECQF